MLYPPLDVDDVTCTELEGSKPAQVIQEGDVVKIYPNTKHWHGATRDSWLVHIAVITNPQKGDAIWLEPVTDEEYNKLN